MKNYASNLEYLMDKLQITGVAISNHLNIDSSLVSKWKRNRRPLTINNSYLKDLSSFILIYKDAVYADTIEEYLLKYYPNLVFHNKSEVEKQLMLWLTETYKPVKQTMNISKKEQLVVSKGLESRRKAILYFFDEILKINTQQNIMLISQEKMSDLFKEASFFIEWRHKISEIIQKGHKFNIILAADKTPEEMTHLISIWLPFYLKANIKSWYLPHYSNLIIKQSLFLLQNKIAITGMEGETSEDCYTAIVNDPITLNQYEFIYNKYLSSCKPLVHTYSLKDTLLPVVFDQFDNNDGDIITYSKFPSFLTLPDYMFREILNKNGNSQLDNEQFSKYYTKLNSLFLKMDIKAMYSNDGFREALNNDNYNYEDFSKITGRDFFVEKNFVSKHLNYLIERPKSDNNFELGINGDFLDFNILVNSEGPVVIWDPKVSDNVIISYEANVVDVFYNKLIREWGSIPRIHKDPERLRKRFLDQ